MFTNISRPSVVDVQMPFAVGDLFAADSTTTVVKIPDIAVGNVLLSGGVGAVPAWGKVTLSSHVSGVLPAVNGGTGVANTGTITNASNTTITGGGTLALGGFTLTVPATGTAGLLAVANTWTAVNTFSNATGATSTTTGAVVVTGGVGIGGGFIVGGDCYIMRNAATGTMYLQNTATGYTAGDGAFWQMASDTLNFGSFENGPLQFWTNGQNRGAFSSAGIFSIASTDAASLTLAGGALFDGATTKTIKYTNGTANAAVAVTFGAVGPTGSTAGNQVGWLRVNIGGTDRYIPYW